jgi:hypothetical protein
LALGAHPPPPLLVFNLCGVHRVGARPPEEPPPFQNAQQRVAAEGTIPVELHAQFACREVMDQSIS